MLRLVLLTFLTITLSGCSGKSLYLTAHSPKGTSYLGKFGCGSYKNLQGWLAADRSLAPAQLTYSGEDRDWVYLSLKGKEEVEVIPFSKSSESLGFTLSGMELSAEWK